MNYYEAIEILNDVRAGNPCYDITQINRALWLTGDLDDIQFERCVLKTGGSSSRYGSQSWLDGLRQGKVTRA